MEREWFFHYLTHVPSRNYAACTGNIEHTLPASLCPAPLLLPKPPVCAHFYPPDCKHRNSATDQCSSGLAGSFNSLSQLLVLLWHRHRRRLPPTFMCKQEPAADGLLSAGGRFRVEQWVWHHTQPHPLQCLWQGRCSQGEGT